MSTSTSDAKFVALLGDVIGRMASLVRTHGPRLQALWTPFWQRFTPTVRTIRTIPHDPGRFATDVEYRVEVLETFEQALADGYHVERQIFDTIFKRMLSGSHSSSDPGSNSDTAEFFSAEARALLGFKMAEKLVGSLQQFIALDPTVIPVEYVIVAKNKAMIRLRGMQDVAIVANVQKSKVPCTRAQVRAVMGRLEGLGLVQVTRTADGSETYADMRDLALPPDDEAFYEDTVAPVLEWAVQLWRSFYNLRELNTPIPGDLPWASFLEKTVSRAATQGFEAAYFVARNLKNYYVMVRDGNPLASGG